MASAKPMIISPIFPRILSRFPQNFTFCFAYGSAVKKQLSNKEKENMIDLIICVENPVSWHEENLKENASHYSALKYLGTNFIAKFQENFGAKVYFNTLVPVDDFYIKYGVVSTKDLITDLLEWSDLYLAGRLHKPVEIIKRASNAELQTALQLNLQSAVHTALLILPETFTEYEFYYAISNLSYAGDFRMTFGENKNKVANIVRPQLLGFRNLYSPFIKVLHDYVDFPMLTQTDNILEKTPSTTSCSQDISPLARLHHLNQLPRWPQKSLTRFWNRGNLRQDTEDVLRAIAYDPDCDVIVQQCIGNVVWRSSVSQSLKSILTAGLMKSVKYSSRKEMNYDSDSRDNDSQEHKDRTSRSHSPQSRLEKYQKIHGSRLSTETTENEDEVIPMGPALPPHLQHNHIKTKSNISERSDSNEVVIGPVLPPHLQKNNQEENDSVGPKLPPHLIKKQTPNEQSCIGPALPPHLLNKESSHNESDHKESEIIIVGPALPPHLQRSAQPSETHTENDDEDDDTYGPLPAGHLNKAQVALEERALQLKMDRLGPAQDETPSREEWMVELPQVKALSALGLGNRQFRSKPGPDLSDRSCWTDTPSGSGKRKAGKSDHLDLKKEAEKAKTKRRDEEQEEMLRKHKKKGKESLLEMHQKKQKQDKKGSGESNERRPFSRDIDLQVNRFDEAQKKAILKKAQLLDDRFSKGQSKFL